MKLKDRLFCIIYYILRIFPVQNNKVVILSYMGKGYGGEGKFIAEELKKQNLDYDIVWLANDPGAFFPDNVRSVKHMSIKSIYEQVTARVWIDNCRKSIFVRKRNEQFYIHTWHGGGPCLKYVEKDAEKDLDPEYIASARNDSKMANALVSGCVWRTKNMQEAFWFNGDIIKCNIAKNYTESLSFTDLKKLVYNYFDLDDNDNIVLYAPTFRKDGNIDCYDIDFERLISTLKQKFGGSWKAIIRLHPSISNKQGLMNYSSSILNGTAYPDIEDLIRVSKLLVTDYSGVMFEGFRYQTRVILYAKDLKHYYENERGMYFDIKKLPAPLTIDNDELNKCMLSFNDEEYELRRSAFVNSIGYYEDGPELIANAISNVVHNK